MAEAPSKPSRALKSTSVPCWLIISVILASDASELGDSIIHPPIVRTSSDTPRLCTRQGRPGGPTSSLKTCMAGDCQTRAIPSRKRPLKPPATRQHGLGESGCGLNRRWPGWKPIPRPEPRGRCPPYRWHRRLRPATPHPSARRRRSPERRIGKRLPATRPIPAVWRRRLHAPILLSGSASHPRLISGSKQVGEVLAIRKRGVNAPNHSLHSPFVRASVLISTSASFGCSDTPVGQRLRPHESTRLYRLTSRPILPTRALVRLTRALVRPTRALVLPTRGPILPIYGLQRVSNPPSKLLRPLHGPEVASSTPGLKPVPRSPTADGLKPSSTLGAPMGVSLSSSSLRRSLKRGLAGLRIGENEVRLA